MTRHALLTAWGFPPARTSGVYRAVALAQALVDDGWEVTVLTAPREVFQRNGITDYSMERGLDERIRIVRVPFSASSYDTDLLDWTRFRARFPEFWQQRRNRDDLRAFPEAEFGGWAVALRTAAEQVHRDKPVDVAIGTANPYVDFVPGAHLKERFGVPYVMDYRDAWTIDVFRGVDSPSATPEQRDWERAAMSEAHEVWFVNRPIRDWHAERHPSVAERMWVVPNGFDRPAEGDLGVPWRAPGEPLVFGYVGTINYGQFPAEALFEGWQHARKVDARLADARLELHGYLGRSGMANDHLGAQLKAAEQHGVTYEGPVPKAEVAQVYRRFDALVLALASGPGVTSGKVYEFAGTGLPIVSVHDRNSAASAVLEDDPVWAPSESLTPDGVAQALSRGADLALAQTPESRAQAIAWGSRWERRALLAPHIAALTESLQQRRA
ncbi:MAG: glycosyltransferase [Marmoricola sp.]